MNDDINSLPVKYNYLDLRFHSHMFTNFDYEDTETWMRSVFIEESCAIADYSTPDIYLAFRRQYEEFVGKWNDECERAIEREFKRMR